MIETQSKMYSLVPSPEEVDFVLEILDRVANPALDKLEELLSTAGHWDNVARNDFCRQVLQSSSLCLK